MSVHLQKQIDKLKRQITAMGNLAEQSLLKAMVAVERRDAVVAEQVIAADGKVDQMELDVEEECLHTLALYQPVASDLRYVVSVLKINNDLERIADMASNIAQQAVFLASEPPVDPMPFDLVGMADRVRRMLARALEAMLNSDPELADTVRASDDEVDTIHRHMYERVEAAMRERPDRIPSFIHLMNISRQLERVADLATNIAEDVIYTARGKLVRHMHE
jgi:phosphate transport system protein